ncbi:Uncharacterised protein [Corynebacterium diphtheriae bv. mitis]|nr:hypothetical protein FRC0474_01795 [Corynebacterium diphtheriae]SUY76705.1 Uncharacterised protein [Corynebacterium diphtheriae bv. mitis]VVH30338.1 hypothetical protein NCPHL90_01774 [Corynebacterium diphtheriae]
MPSSVGRTTTAASRQPANSSNATQDRMILGGIPFVVGAALADGHLTGLDVFELLALIGGELGVVS